MKEIDEFIWRIRISWWWIVSLILSIRMIFDLHHSYSFVAMEIFVWLSIYLYPDLKICFKDFTNYKEISEKLDDKYN